MPPAASTSGASSEAAWSMAGDKQRSSFVLKLHELLCEGEHPEYLYWVNNDTFAITSIDANARLALSPHWEFNSLSSFIRQLSYYSFKRLTDRRRSTERRPSMPAYIVFTHPSGNFVRYDGAKALLIPRKIRARKSGTKKDGSKVDTRGTRQSPSPSAASTRSTAPVFSGSAPRASTAPELYSCLEVFQLPPRSLTSSVSAMPISPRAILPNAAPPGLFRRPEDGGFALQSPPTRVERQRQARLLETSYPPPIVTGSCGAYYGVSPEQAGSFSSRTERDYATLVQSSAATSVGAEDANGHRANGMVGAPRTPPPSGEDSSPAVLYSDLPPSALTPPKYTGASRQADDFGSSPPFANTENRYRYLQLSLVQPGISPPPSPPHHHFWSLP